MIFLVTASDAIIIELEQWQNEYDVQKKQDKTF